MNAFEDIILNETGGMRLFLTAYVIQYNMQCNSFATGLLRLAYIVAWVVSSFECCISLFVHRSI